MYNQEYKQQLYELNQQRPEYGGISEKGYACIMATGQKAPPMNKKQNGWKFGASVHSPKDAEPVVAARACMLDVPHVFRKERY